MDMAAYPPYDSYKDSGVNWIGSIPINWTLLRSKYVWCESVDLSILGEETLLSVSQNHGVIPRQIDSRSEDLSGYRLVRKGELVSNIMLAWMGSLAVSKYDGIVSPAYSVYRLQADADQTFLDYLYKTAAYLAEFTRHSTGVVPSRWRLYTESFGKIPTLLPPLPEQRAIAAFLDEKCAGVDKAVRIKEVQIALLHERRQIMIQQAVTRGLNPAASTKDSGIDWIGQIPAHWEVQKLKFISSIFRGKFTHRPRNDPSLYDGDYPFFQTGDVAQAGMYLSDYRQTLNEKGLKVSTLIPKGTILITIAANIGDITILNVDGCFPDSVVGFKPASTMQRNFLYFSMLSMKQVFMQSSIANAQANLNVERIGAISICIPPSSEQTSIIDYLSAASEKLDTAITIKQDQIAALKEYKTSLINAAVTGKIKVI